jgi:hypothetical protein
MKRRVIKTAEELCEYSPRLWKNEQEAADFIEEKLDDKGVDFSGEEYQVTYPHYPEYWLEVDGEEIECLPSGFESGEITEKVVVDNLHTDFEGANLNFNPKCPDISKQTMYEAPALTIARKDVQKVLEADHIHGRLEVEWKHQKGRNFLVGNTKDPKLVVFTHYDSWWGGFLDNAFSVSLLIHLAPELDLENVLIVFVGSEEVSQEKPYWCYGYRKFEERHHEVIEKCEDIVVIDTIGRGETMVSSESELMEEALVLNSREYIEKTEMIVGEFDKVMEIYHSPIDTRDKLTHPEDAIETVKGYFSDHLQS